jgi:glutamine---fructose-6-phosphate transaminase (isomerizing)
MSQLPPTTEFERQIRSQPEELTRILASARIGEQLRVAAEGLHRARRIWMVGTGSSQNAAALGAGMIQEAGRSAHAVSSMQFVRWAPIVGPQDAVIVITHTAETAYAMAARGLAANAGLNVVTITRIGAGLPTSIETVERETSQSYTVSYTATLLVLAMLAAELGAESPTQERLAMIPGAVRRAIESSGLEEVPAPERLLVITGSGPASVTAREGALKAREAARVPAEGFDAEYLLHGSAVPLTAQDRLIVLATPDPDGFDSALAAAAAGEGIPVTRLEEQIPLPPLLAQIPLTVRLQMLALKMATERGQNPDVVITGSWADKALWAIGSPQS